VIRMLHPRSTAAFVDYAIGVVDAYRVLAVLERNDVDVTRWEFEATLGISHDRLMRAGALLRVWRIVRLADPDGREIR
jgi:hypothetical protein